MGLVHFDVDDLFALLEDDEVNILEYRYLFHLFVPALRVLFEVQAVPLVEAAFQIEPELYSAILLHRLGFILHHHQIHCHKALHL